MTSRPRHKKGRGQTRTSHSGLNRRTPCVWRRSRGALHTSPIKTAERDYLQWISTCQDLRRRRGTESHSVELEEKEEVRYEQRNKQRRDTQTWNGWRRKAILGPSAVPACPAIPESPAIPACPAIPEPRPIPALLQTPFNPCT